MKRREFFDWMNLGALTAFIPASIYAKALTRTTPPVKDADGIIHIDYKWPLQRIDHGFYRDYTLYELEDGEWEAEFRYYDRGAGFDWDIYRRDHPNPHGWNPNDKHEYSLYEKSLQREYPTLHAISKRKLIWRINAVLGTKNMDDVTEYWKQERLKEGL